MSKTCKHEATSGQWWRWPPTPLPLNLGGSIAVCEALLVAKAGTSGNGYAWEFQSYNQRDSDPKWFGLMVATFHSHKMESSDTTVLFVWNTINCMIVNSWRFDSWRLAFSFLNKVGYTAARNTSMVNVQTVVSTKAWTVESSQILSWKPCCLNSLYVEIVIYNWINWFMLIIFLCLCVMFLTDCVYLCVHTLEFWLHFLVRRLHVITGTDGTGSQSPGHRSLGMVPSRHLCRPRTLWIGAPWPGPLCVVALRPPDAWRETISDGPEV